MTANGPVFVFPDAPHEGFAALSACRAAGLEPVASAGYGGGEYAALVAAGALPAEAGARLAKARGEALATAAAQRAGTMAVVCGLDAAVVARCCADVNGVGVAVVAALEAPEQIVISGETPAVQAASALCRQRGAEHVAPRDAGGAFHSPLMELATVTLRGVLELTSVFDPVLPFVSGVTARTTRTAAEVRSNLAVEAACPVRWSESVERLVADGYTTFVECGPGAVLSELIRRIAPGARVLSAKEALAT